MIRPCQLRLWGRGQDIVVFREIDMKHASQMQFGRPVEVVQAAMAGPDKWDLLRKLTTAAEDFDLSHRTLSVFKALLTFLPSREIPQGPKAIVFPSNSTLSDRLSGMPESTLRRHLHKLVQTGVVSRQDSPNRKRYARHVRGGVQLAFGFDLSPLVHMQQDLSRRAEAAQERQEQLLALRDHVAALRASLLAQEGQGALTEEVALLLRRKPKAEALQTASDRLRERLDKTRTTELSADNLSDADSQNERHIQYLNKYDLDSEGGQSPTPSPEARTDAQNKNRLSLLRVTQTCKSFASFFPDKIRHWQDMIRVSDQLAPMIGIEQPVVYQAKKRLGAEATAVVILCILEKLNSIQSPGAYLRHLIKVGARGGNPGLSMLEALENRELSADNHKYCLI